jgi:hypothetical protein
LEATLELLIFTGSSCAVLPVAPVLAEPLVEAGLRLAVFSLGSIAAMVSVSSKVQIGQEV